MPPKKNEYTASTPIANKAGVFPGLVDSIGLASKEGSSLVVRSEITDVLLDKTKKLSTLELVYKAIEVVGVPRKGASYIAIQKWIIDNKENVVIGRLKANLKKAVIKALEEGSLKRANVSKNAIGIRGFFMINKDKTIKIKTTTKKTVAKKEKKEIFERTALSDTEVTKIPRKRNAGRLNNSLTEDTDRKKVIFKSKTNILGAKVNSKSEKEKNKPDPKEKTAAISKKNNAVVPKAKNAPVRKAKPIVAFTSAPESEVASTSEEEFENVAISKPKVVKMSKLKAKVKPISKSKSKVVGEKKLLEGAEPIPNQQITERLKKKVSTKSSRMNPKTNKLKDLSDSELTVKPVNRTSLKSYSSDTEVDFVKKEKAFKAARSKLKTVNIKKSQTEVGEAGPSKAIKKQKAKNTV